MPSSWSSSLRLELQFTGENLNIWGEKLNAALAHADYAIAGWLERPMSGDATLTTANAGDDEARAAMIRFTGAPPTAAAVTLPSVSKSYFVWNATDKALTFTTGAGATVTVDPDDRTLVFCDGAGVHTLGYGGLALKDYITAFSASEGAVPAPLGNAGKYLFSDGANVLWRAPSTADLSDYQAKVLGVQVALAAAL
jgi:hypothetical protein